MEYASSHQTKTGLLVTNRKNAYVTQEGERTSLRPGYDFQTITQQLKQESAPNLDAAKYFLTPGIATNPALIVDKVELADTIIRGSAIWLALDPLGTIRERHLHADDHMSVEYGEDWLITWIANRTGATILGTSTPPFTDEMETNVRPGQKNIGSRTIPNEYWELYRRYTTNWFKP